MFGKAYFGILSDISCINISARQKAKRQGLKEKHRST